MGSSGSKGGGGQSFLGGGKKKNYSRNDGCIGSRKVRTITLSILLIVFCAMGMSYFFNEKDYWDSLHVNLPLVGDTCEKCLNAKTAFTIIIAGGFTIIAAAVFAILLFVIDCDDKVGRVAGFLLIIGGVAYIGGWLYYISVYNEMIHQYLTDTIWDNLSDETKNRINASLAAEFGEALLPSMTAILLGFDVFVHLFDSEHNRLFSNLGNLCFVAILTGPVYYMLTQDDEDITTDVVDLVLFPSNSDAYPWIATGYMVIFGFTLAYIILYIFTCCTCDCKDTKVMRLLMALGLIVGGVLTCIGYWIFAGEFTSENADEPTDITIYYIGYTLMIGGVCFIWALDIGLEDIKG